MSLIICQLCKELMYKHFLTSSNFPTKNHILILTDHFTIIKSVNEREINVNSVASFSLLGYNLFF